MVDSPAGFLLSYFALQSKGPGNSLPLNTDGRRLFAGGRFPSWDW